MVKGRYLRCSECKGSGSKSLQSTCTICSGKTTIPCDNCREGAVLCTSCNGMGKQSALVFFSVSCSMCKGKGSLVCSTCKGTAKKKCPKCNGTGNISYPTKCTVCDGSGRVEDEEFRAWANSLQEFSVDRLRDEKDRRQHKIRGCRSKVEQIEADQREDRDAWNTDPASSKYCQHGWTVNESSYSQLAELEATIESLEEEIDMVQEVLDTKLK